MQLSKLSLIKLLRQFNQFHERSSSFVAKNFCYFNEWNVLNICKEKNNFKLICLIFAKTRYIIFWTHFYFVICIGCMYVEAIEVSSIKILDSSGIWLMFFSLVSKTCQWYPKFCNWTPQLFLVSNKLFLLIIPMQNQNKVMIDFLFAQSRDISVNVVFLSASVQTFSFEFYLAITILAPEVEFLSCIMC